MTHDPADDDVRTALIAACRHLSAAGLSPGSSGNVSVLAGDHVLITPTGSSLARVAAGDLAVVHRDGTVVDGRPSKELPLHRAVYTGRREARAVVHLHSPYAVAAACRDVPPGQPALPPLTPYGVMRLGDLPIAPYAAPGSTDLADGVAVLAGAHAALLIAHHGSIAAGASLDAACELAEEVEAAAQVTFLLHGHPHTPLPPDAVAHLRPASPRAES